MIKNPASIGIEWGLVDIHIVLCVPHLYSTSKTMKPHSVKLSMHCMSSPKIGLCVNIFQKCLTASISSGNLCRCRGQCSKPQWETPRWWKQYCQPCEVFLKVYCQFCQVQRNELKSPNTGSIITLYV